MNHTLDSIAQRYSCRDFADTPLADAQVEAIAQAALAAPSAMNRQPWQVIIVTDRTLIQDMSAECRAIRAKAEPDQPLLDDPFYNAPCLVMIAIDDSKYAKLDCGILSQNVALAAQGLGLGSLICGNARPPLDGPRGAEFIQRLQFPDGYQFGMAVLLGTALSGKEPHELDQGKVTLIPGA